MRRLHRAVFARFLPSVFLAVFAGQVVRAEAPPASAGHGPAASVEPAPAAKPTKRSHHLRAHAAPAKPPTHAAAEKPAAVQPGAAPPTALPLKPPAKPLLPAPEHAAPQPPSGAASGLPLPRFAALRSDEVNLRAGPGTRYPIDWVYKRRDLPVEIEREFEVWRLVAAPDGEKGWVHQATLTGRRSFIVMGGERRLRATAGDAAAAVARLKPGVIGRILHCDGASEWCRVQVDDYRGWLKRSEFWGSFAGEAVN